MAVPKDPHEIARLLSQLRWAHLARRVCTAAEPMQMADEKRFRWGHPDAEVVGTFLNLLVCKCPHCDLTFTCMPPEPQGPSQ